MQNAEVHKNLRQMWYNSREAHSDNYMNQANIQVFLIIIMILCRLWQCCIITLLKKKPSEINKCSIVKVVVVICWSWESMSRMICSWRQCSLRKDGPLNHQGPSSLVFLLLLPHTSSPCWIKDYLHIRKIHRNGAWMHSLWNGTVCDKGRPTVYNLYVLP